MSEQERDIEEVLAIYLEKLAKFKEEMESIGVKVKVSASLGKWTSVLEEAEKGEAADR